MRLRAQLMYYIAWQSGSDVLCQCYHYWNIADHVFEPGECAACGSVMVKPGIVFFGEMAPEYEALHWLIEDLKSTDTFVIVGTSLNVVNPIAMIRSAGKYPQIIFIDKNILLLPKRMV
ncbi:NAD-dependent deacetylase [Iodobacter fluviatilis]|uniref:NAD-dependent deacetylase n=2 Tax=Iodobacter fluviatilis TaxID=537 RepID=A0A377SXM9_9NEIS|nr:NAD-dependent deacetylase [Iodobacter fluviatilis]